MKLFFANLTKLFEKSYELNGKPSLAVAHSLGNMVFTYFMATKQQSWKDKYVAGYVALSGPLGGAAKLFRLFVSGRKIARIIKCNNRLQYIMVRLFRLWCSYQL